jgi:hypothetical protein
MRSPPLCRIIARSSSPMIVAPKGRDSSGLNFFC